MSPRLTLAWVALAALANATAQEALPVDPQSGLIIDDDWKLVSNHCGACHSTRLVTQNRMSAEGWTQTIRWMQAEHNLWPLGKDQAPIVAYLAKHYGVPEFAHRRAPLNQPPLDPESSHEQGSN